MQTPAQVEPVFQIYPLSEHAVTLEFGQVISENVSQRVRLFNGVINDNPFPGFYATVPAYTTLTIFYDPSRLSQSGLPGADCYEKLSAYLYSVKTESGNIATTPAENIVIPVCYGGAFGPDLDYVAGFHHLSADEVIALHSAAVYEVYMIGFVPGFAYLGGMSDLLSTPRKASPRKAIPAGSVGIAGAQTGIYPLETPGGWQIIGRTPVVLFNPRLQQPALVRSGDHVVFKPVDHLEFDHLVS